MLTLLVHRAEAHERKEGDHQLAYRVGGALMLVSTALVLGTTLVLDAMATPHGWHRHAIVYGICAIAAVMGVWQMRRKRIDSVWPLYASTPVLIALSCAPLLLVHTLPAAMAGVLITLTNLLLTWPNLYAASVLPVWASLSATGTIIVVYAGLIDVTDDKGRLVAWCIVSAWLIALAIAVEVVRGEAESALAAYRREATHDPLTGLPNRRAFSRFLDTTVASSARHGRPVALLVLDVDHFKSINDRFGHPQGDTVLSGLGRLLGEQIRPGDLAARIGGEEFAVVLPDCSLDDAVTRANSLCATVEDASERWGHRITASLGVAASSAGTVSGAHLLADADRALYQAKDDGRNRVRRSPPSRAA